jgi:Big-like domain-containing protein
MKKIHPTSLAKSFSVSLCLSLTLAAAAFAQTSGSNLIPVVTIQATQPIATVTDSGVFTVFRAGNTNATLNVWYDLGGTASNGVDYATIPPHLVEIPAGATSNTIVITPLTNPPPSSAAKTVVLQLTNSPLMTPVNYEIGSPSSAVVYIEATNPQPVGIINPKEGAIFYAPTNIQIVAFLKDVNGLTNVEFFAGTNDLGEGSLNIGAFGGFSGLTWTNPPVGNYALTAVASYNDLASATSAPVNITVQLPPTNLPPVVEISSPTDGAVFYTPVNISLIARASDPDGTVTNVEFFAGTTDLGRGLPVVLDPPGVNGVTGLVYFFNWQNVPTNSYSLTAVATDNGGLSTTSAPVSITVLPGPPPTNLPPVVRITSPPNGSVFRAPINIPIYAYAADPDGSVTSVEFFAGSNSLGFGQRVSAVPPPLPPGPIQPPILIVMPTNYWGLLWTNPPLGTNIALTAKATDNGGASTVSDPVLVSILPSLPPPTNRPPIVSIIATDPVAIEGTNCWPWLGLAGVAPTWSNWFAASPPCRLFTNCGPKDATFTVFRFGATNDDLNVAYAIGGTATNGIDYVALPGLVTIPAGERRAAITILPLDDGPPDINSTVILKLAAGTNYLVGFPSCAAAIILDRPSPRAVAGMMPGACFHLSATGPDGAWFHVEYSADLIHWTPICTNQVVNGCIDFVDPDAATNPSRFYRTVPELGGPPQ